MGRNAPADLPDHHLKSSWPEVVGWPELPAGIKIVTDRHDVTACFFPVGTHVPPPDYDPKRVAVFVDDSLRVAQTPVIG